MKLEDVQRLYVQSYNEVKSLGHTPRHSMKEHTIYVVDYDDFCEDPVTDFQAVKVDEAMPTGSVSVILNCRKAPDPIKFLMFSVILVGDNHNVQVIPAEINKIGFRPNKNNSLEQYFKLVFRYLLYKINQKDTYLGIENITMKKKSGQTEIKPISYVCSRRNLIKRSQELSNKIEWKHSWECIGHWRICRTIGKDRDGTYNQFNRTWVKPCIKGEGTLIKKLKILRN